MKSNNEIACLVIQKEFNRQKEYYPTLSLSKMIIRDTKEFTFILFFANIGKDQKWPMHRYYMACLRGFEVIYSDSNVTDAKHFYNINDVIKKSKSYFEYYSELLNK